MGGVWGVPAQGNTGMTAQDGNKTITWLGLNFGELYARDHRAFSCPDTISLPPFNFEVLAPPSHHMHVARSQLC